MAHGDKKETDHSSVVNLEQSGQDHLDEIQSKLLSIQGSFPNGIDYSFGYGSGVFPQVSSNTEEDEFIDSADQEQPMVDLIFSVSDPLLWHEQNLSRHKEHYALLPRLLGAKFISWVQGTGAGVYFNPMVKMESGSIQSLLKYGVISTSKLKNDLKEWDSLYIAGRMQKPTSILSICDDEIIEIQEKHNLRYALSAALLLLPEEELRRDFQLPASKVFESLAELSYIGDPRIKAGAEDPLKISKLVHSPGQLQRFQSMYRGEFTRLQSMGILSIGNGGKNIEINTHDQGTRRALAARLPSKLQNQTVDEKHQLSSSFLRQSLARIVSRPAQIQSGKGIVTAGVYKSILYAGAKLAKGAFSGR